MRFLADENVSRLVIERPRQCGFDVTPIGEKSSGASDDEVFATAANGDRILITGDRDFGEMVVRQRLRVHGVILLELDRLSNSAEASRVTAVVSGNTEKLDNNLIVIEPGRFAFAP